MPSTLFNRLPQAALLLSPNEAETTILAANDAATRQTNLSQLAHDTWIGTNLYSVFPWMEQAEIAHQAFTSLQDQPSPLTYGCRVVYEDRIIGYVDVTLAPLEGKQVLLTLSDVMAVPLSNQLTQRLNATLDSIPDAIVLTGPDRRIVRINPAFEALFGYTLHDVAGQTTEILYESSDAYRQAGRERFNLSAEEKRKPYEIRYRHKDGRLFISETVGTPIRNNQGDVLGFLGLIRDITKRKTAEHALRDSQRFVSRIAQALPDILYVFDLTERRNVYANRELTSVLGYSTAEVQAMGDQLMPKLLHPDDMQEVFEHFGRMQRAHVGEVLEVTYRMRNRSGDWRWLYSRETPLALTPQGEVTQYVGVAQDITSQREATAALQASEERLELALYGGGLGLWDWSITTGKVIMNERWAEMVGYTLDELAPDFSTWERLVHPEDLASTVTVLNEHLAGHIPIYEAELRMRHKAGHWVWVLTRGRVTERDADGEPTRVAGTHLDITERHHTTAALERREERMRLLYDLTLETDLTYAEQIEHALARTTVLLGLDVGILSEIDPATDLYTVVHCYAPGTSLEAGATFDLGNTYCSILLQSDDVLAIEHMNRTKHRSHPCYAAFSLESYIGVTLYVRGKRYGTLNFSAATPREEAFSHIDHELLHLLGRWVASLLERQQAEANLQEYASALEQSNIELEQFAYLASHDLQEPLRTIRSFLQLLAKDLGDDLTANQQQFFNFVNDGAERMQALIRALLELSRAGRRDLTLESINLGALTARITESLQTAFDEQDATITYDTLPTVTADPTLIGLVLQNLISNGIKFRSEAAPKVHLSASKHDRFWHIAVRDNGIGIAPKFHAQVFEIFKRLHGRTKYKGTGIGLAICKKIVERHGGTIWVESEPGQGATFIFSLPQR
ncbi:MAG: hypothetical protein RhofKO_10090 [Rhodothermales bacterium]